MNEQYPQKYENTKRIACALFITDGTDHFHEIVISLSELVKGTEISRFIKQIMVYVEF